VGDATRSTWASLPVLSDHRWQMAFGERMALEGILSQLQPELAIEIGTAEGGSLRRIAAHSREVHSFDWNPDVAAVVEPIPNARAHIGDSSEVLPRVLAELAEAGRRVDFALVDGDHSAEGVRRDVEVLLASPACERTVIVLHDSANEAVRDGLESLDLPNHPRVEFCMLDFVPGYIVVEEHERSHEIWNGLGVVVLDAAGAAGPALVDADHVNVSSVYRAFRDVVKDRRTA
jgi:Methyltransferase domain